MDKNEIMMYAIGVVVACALYVARVVLAYYKVEGAVRAFDKYKPFAVMAAKWVESQVPNDYGVNTSDPSTARALHKLDLFLQKFNEIVKIQEGAEPSKLLQHEAMNWSVELAERMNLTGMKEVLNGVDKPAVEVPS